MKLRLQCEEAIEPVCPHFGQCGGCSYQHVPYDEQLLQKEAFVRTLFNREVDPILPCEPPWRYRNKMEFSFSQAKSGEKFLGLMRKKGRVENLNVCYLTNPWFTDLLGRVRQWWESNDVTAYHPPTDRGSLRTLTLREGVYTGEKMIVLTVSGNPEFALNQGQLQGFIEAVGHIEALLLRTHIIEKKTPTRFEESVLLGRNIIYEKMHNRKGEAFTFRIRAASFFQPNTLQAEALYACALERAQLEKEEVLYDLYCGTGTLGIFASREVKKVIGLEINPDSILDAKENLKLNGVHNMQIAVGDVGKVDLSIRPTTIIVDPPRVGLSSHAIKYLIECAPEKIVYVSCNPETQLSNCQNLEVDGYHIERISPIDQFPHTPHVENIVFLRRNS